MASNGLKAGCRALETLGLALLLANSPVAAAAVERGGRAAMMVAHRGGHSAGLADGWRIERWGSLISEAAARFGVPEQWIRRVMRAESGGRTLLDGRPITSSAGAMGLMQLMPRTWAEMRTRHGLGPDPHDPRDNILAGTAYLRAMYDRFGYPGLFAAYNAGPGRYAAHLASGGRLPAETVAYVAAVAPNLPSRLAGIGKQHRLAGLFVPSPAVRAPPTGAGRPPGASDGLFVRLTTASAAPD